MLDGMLAGYNESGGAILMHLTQPGFEINNDWW